MGACVSSGSIEVSKEERQMHQEAERRMKEARSEMDRQMKVLLLGSGDSGKSTILKQMRLIHKLNFTPQEIETFRQLVYMNLIQGLTALLDAMPEMELDLDDPSIMPLLEEVVNAKDLKDGEPFPPGMRATIERVWADKNVQVMWSRANEAALPENLHYFFLHLPRYFEPSFKPTEQDIVHCRARTIGISETVFNLRDHTLLMVDVGGQKSERRKWIHCFQDVSSILFLVSLSGYDQCVLEDKDVNQMQDSMAVWDSICHSAWFKKTSIILFLNKNDLFERKIVTSDIETVFSDFKGPAKDPRAGREYFKNRFAALSKKPGVQSEREIYIHVTTATDTEMLRVIMASVEDSIIQTNIRTLMLGSSTL